MRLELGVSGAYTAFCEALSDILRGLVLFIPAVHSEAPIVRVVEFETTVNPVTALRVTKAIELAEEEGAELVLIRLDTPGGLVTSMETIVKRILNSDVPVVTWVGPAGSHAASAASSSSWPATSQRWRREPGRAPPRRCSAPARATRTTSLLKKANEDSAALLRSIAARRGRNSEASEETVFSAKSYEEQVALALGLVDVVAKDIDELLAWLDAREISRFDDRPRYSVPPARNGSRASTPRVTHSWSSWPVRPWPTCSFRSGYWGSTSRSRIPVSSFPVWWG